MEDRSSGVMASLFLLGLDRSRYRAELIGDSFPPSEPRDVRSDRHRAPTTQDSSFLQVAARLCCVAWVISHVRPGHDPFLSAFRGESPFGEADIGQKCDFPFNVSSLVGPEETGTSFFRVNL